MDLGKVFPMLSLSARCRAERSKPSRYAWAFSTHCANAASLVWNDARAIERCVDKSMTSFVLSHAGIATPATWATQSYEQARAITQRETADGPLVLKPLFGSQGRGLRLIRKPDDLPQTGDVAGGVWYLQRFVGVERGGFHDFRLLVVQGRVIAAMQRHSTHWITNVKRGGRPVAAVVNDEMTTLAAAGRNGRWGGFCRGRYPLWGRPTTDRARGQQHAGLVGTAEGYVRQHRVRLRRSSYGYSRCARAARSDGVTSRVELIAAAFKWACLAELDAPKPGNVHVLPPVIG